MRIPRRFISINRTIDPKTGDHILDAIAHDGTAWWQIIASDEDGCTGWEPMTAIPEWETRPEE